MKGRAACARRTWGRAGIGISSGGGASIFEAAPSRSTSSRSDSPLIADGTVERRSPAQVTRSHIARTFRGDGQKVVQYVAMSR